MKIKNSSKATKQKLSIWLYFNFIKSAINHKVTKKMSEGGDSIIFVFFIVSLFVAIKESNAEPLMNIEFINSLFYKSDNGSDIYFTISTGYMTGFFVWFLDSYIPRKARHHRVTSALRIEHIELIVVSSNLIKSLEIQTEREGFFKKYNHMNSLDMLAFLLINEAIQKDKDFNCYSIIMDEFKKSKEKLLRVIDKICAYQDFLTINEIKAITEMKASVYELDILLDTIDTSEQKLQKIFWQIGIIGMSTLEITKNTQTKLLSSSYLSEIRA